ncbi:ubiquinol-cytochrome c reductase iron-sulfur subunit [Glycomyces buryatensis]|uniref:Cytochrome bc1 complex Rieske iron-sulfur subunit n=1 Tax=Glycomyces buryatensis TaxID=2570927 RepID=A0A4S8QC28_9ACTN|nr:Rieske 2Fe-2S domain-containing protein [Glycomyces buryatensis]THV38599.1 (2Fe-2S)-binding protein [Glycomyces buryatensis]
MSAHNDDSQPEKVDLDDPKLSRFDVYREGLRKDGIEIIHYEPRFAKPGTAAEKRMERIVSGLFLLSGLFATAFVAAYIFWPWEYEGAASWREPQTWYTPVIGITLGLSLLLFAVGVLTWAKKLLPIEELVQDRHDGGSAKEDRKFAESTVDTTVDDMGIRRRPFLVKAALLGAAPLGLAAVAPLGALIKDPADMLTVTGWNAEKYNEGNPVRLMMKDGALVRPDMVSAGGQITVYPAIEHGASNEFPTAPSLLIHLREQDAELLRENLYPMYQDVDALWGNYVAYSKICTHVGCPASLYEQQSQRLLCPCHQSQFNVVDNAAPIFGPATRHLPMLPLSVDEDGHFFAKSDFLVPPGPGYWNRPSLPEEDEQ